MKIFVVRHGESVGNEKRVHQSKDTPLSEDGLIQAESLAERFTKIPVDLILASPYKRTKQTTEAISRKFDKPVEYLDILVENKRPTEIEGSGIDEPEVKAIREEIGRHRLEPDYHYGDEENLFDFIKRVDKVIKKIETVEVENLLVVTHGMVIRTMLAIILFGKDLSPEKLIKMNSFLKTTNTGITEYLFDKDKGWSLVSWNDRAHLG